MDRCIELFFAGKFEGACFQLMLSKALGSAIIFFAFVLKVPQIKNMLQLKTDKGLSYVSIYSEIITLLLMSLYSHHNKNPFSTYGENVVILAQVFIILCLAWKYSEQKGNWFLRVLGLLALIGFSALCIMDLYIPSQLWFLIGSSSIPLMSIGRISQIVYSYRKKYTGALSSFTFTLNVIGGVARIFTTITETGDALLIFTFAYAVLLSLIILVQIQLYGKNKTEKVEKLD